MNNVFEVLLLNLEDNACLVDNLSTILLTAAASQLTIADNRVDYFEDNFKGNNDCGDDDSRLPQSASTSHKLDNFPVGGRSSSIQ